MHDTTVPELFDDKLVNEQILLVRVRLDAANEVGLAFVYLLHELVKGVLRITFILYED